MGVCSLQNHFSREVPESKVTAEYLISIKTETCFVGRDDVTFPRVAVTARWCTWGAVVWQPRAGDRDGAVFALPFHIFYTVHTLERNKRIKKFIDLHTPVIEPGSTRTANRHCMPLDTIYI